MIVHIIGRRTPAAARAVLAACVVTASLAAAPAAARADAAPVIVVGAHAPQLGRLAAGEVQRYLYELTGDKPVLTTDAELADCSDGAARCASGPMIVIGRRATNTVTADMASRGLLPSDEGAPGPEGYVIKTVTYDGRPTIAVDGADAHGTLYGSYALLQRYGARFYIDRDVLPQDRKPFAVKQLDVSEHPYVGHRGLLPWFDFVNGPNPYDLSDWKRYIDAMAKMRMNTLMLHVYQGGYQGQDIDEPFLGFTCNGAGYDSALETSASQVPWALAKTHTDDMAFRAGDFYPFSVFGSDAARYTAGQPDERVNTTLKAKAMMRQIIHYAAQRGVDVVLGTDLDELPQPLDDAGCKWNDEDVLKARVDDMLDSYPELKYIQMYYGEDSAVNPGKVSTADADKAMRFIRDYLEQRRPRARLVTGGWFQEERFPQMDSELPKDVVFSSLTPYDMTVKPQWHLSNGREGWAVPWMELDNGLSEPQLAASRMQQQLPKLRATGSVDGVIGLLWRERAAESNIAYLAEEAWRPDDQPLDSDAFYRDYAAHTLGPDAAGPGADALEDLERSGTYPGVGSQPSTTPEFAGWSFCGCPEAAGRAASYRRLEDEFRDLAPHVTSATGRDSLDFFTQFMRWDSEYWTAQQKVPAAAAEAQGKLVNYFLVDPGGAGEGDLQPDTGSYGTGYAANYGNPITNDFGYPQAMQSVRWCPSSCGYRFTVPPGYTRYRVELYFAEIAYGVVFPGDPTGKRVFDISINGTPVRTDFDVAKAAGGADKGVKLTFDVPVTDRTLDISFTPVKAEPAVNVIRAYPIDAEGNALPKAYDPEPKPVKAWEDLKASGFHEAIDAYEGMVRDKTGLGGLVSAAGGRWYFSAPASECWNCSRQPFASYRRQVFDGLAVPPPGSFTVRGTTTGAVLSWRPPERGEEVTGYNVYRRPASGGTFQRLTRAPVTGRSYEDEAHGDYVYAVTAVGADGTDSPRSFEEPVQAGAADDTPPRILELPARTTAAAHQPLDVAVTAVDGRAADELTAVLHYRSLGAVGWRTVAMHRNIRGEPYTVYARIPRDAVTEAGVEYYVSVNDGANTALAPVGATEHPASVTVLPSPGGRAPTVTRPTVSTDADGALLHWSGRGPVQEYRIYRGTSPDFIPGPDNYLTYVASGQTEFRDSSAGSGGRYYYRIAASTIDGRVGPASPAGS